MTAPHDELRRLLAAAECGEPVHMSTAILAALRPGSLHAGEIREAIIHGAHLAGAGTATRNNEGE